MAVALSGCEVSPLLDDQGNTPQELIQIEFKIDSPKAKDSYILKKRLTELFSNLHQDISKQYLVKIELQKSTRNVSLYSDGAVGRDETTYTCKYELLDKADGAVVLSDSSSSSESHNALFASSNIVESTYGASGDTQIERIAQLMFNHIILAIHEDRKRITKRITTRPEPIFVRQ